MKEFLKEFFLKLFNRDYAMFGTLRSPKWSEVRNAFLKENPRCAVCGQTAKKHLVVHHKKPYHKFPLLELLKNNLETLCESPGMNCHITFGHLGNFKSYNQFIEEDINIWKQKISTRP